MTTESPTFTINQVRISNKTETIWKSDNTFERDGEYDLTLPGSIVSEPCVERRVTFVSTQDLQSLRLEEDVLFKGRPLEQWNFQHGPVKAGTVTDWKMEIFASPETQMMPLRVLSGKTTIISRFFGDGDVLLTSYVHKLKYV